MPSPRLSKALREELLAKLCVGHDLQAAMANLSLTQRQIDSGGAKLAAEIGEAYKIGTARLRARIMESALSGDNAAVLMKLLEQREAAQAAGEAGAQITEIRHVIIDETPQEKRERFAHARNAKCVHCGHSPFTDTLPE